MNTLKFAFSLMRISLKASLSLRSAFIMQMILMLVNNLIFFLVWWILFQRYNDINGWQLDDVQLLYGLGAGSFGIAVILGSNARFLADKILTGELDAYLVQPKNALLHLSMAKSSSSGWGDILSALILFYWSGINTWSEIAYITLLLFSGGMIFLAVMIIANSLVFWLNNMEGFQNQIYEFLILFSTYPEGLFDGPMKIFLFTLIPAGFVSYLPVEAINTLSFGKLLICLTAGIVYLVLACWVFHRGLRRYESGNIMGSGS